MTQELKGEKKRSVDILEGGGRKNIGRGDEGTPKYEARLRFTCKSALP